MLDNPPKKEIKSTPGKPTTTKAADRPRDQVLNEQAGTLARKLFGNWGIQVLRDIKANPDFMADLSRLVSYQETEAAKKI